ncbi:MAG: hypothetical protein HYW79_04110 [Parcubacteria group bacterium]|nr:hypothetical protein [Parcubacteria group bacterium]
MNILYTILVIFLSLWWLWLPVFLIAIFIELWTQYLKSRALKKINWLLLEIKIPRDIQKTPKSMEQVFAGLHGVLTGIKFLDKYWKGKVQEWFSFEIAGIDGMVYFFIRTPEQFRNLVEAQIHAQYPDAEILEVLDYAGPMGNKVPSKTNDISGAELILDKDDFYPIRTYLSFEEKEEERQVDPMAPFLEILSKLKSGENIFIQYLMKPTNEKSWKEKGVEAINKLVGKKVEKKKSLITKIFGGLEEFIRNLMIAPAVYPEWGAAKKEESKTSTANLSPGEKTVVEAIENKMSKLAFKTGIRFAYIARSDVFNRANMAAVNGAFKQFNTVNLNAFKSNGEAGTSAGQPFKKRREYLKKSGFMSRYIKRKWPKKDFILNIEELATIYHYPVIVVEAPTLRRVDSKKAEPPVSLPIG